MGLASLSRPAGGTLSALVRLTPPIGTVWLARVLLDGRGPGSGAAWWVAGAAAAVLAVRLLPLGAGTGSGAGARRAAGSAGRAAAAVTGGAALGCLLWTDQALAVVTAAPVAVGAWAERRAAGLRAAGTRAAGRELAAVAAGLGRLADAVTAAGPPDRAEAATAAHLAAVDRFHEVFEARTRRVVTVGWLAETALSPVTLIAVVLASGAVLGTPGAELPVFLVLAPVVGGCASAWAGPGREPGPGPPPRVARRRVGGALRLLRGPGTGRAVTAAAGCAVLHAAAPIVATAALTRLLTADGAGARPWLCALLAVAAGHAAASRYAAGRARATGVELARRLAYRVAARTLTMPADRLDGDATRGPARLATADVVAVSGLLVHHLRPLAAALVVPGTAAAGCLWLALAGGREPAVLVASLVLGMWCADATHAALATRGALRLPLAAAWRLRDVLFPPHHTIGISQGKQRRRKRKRRRP